MQQKESFLKTKKGKIVVGSVVGSVVGLLAILVICYIIGCWPFSNPSITDYVDKFGVEVKALVTDKAEDDKTKNNTIVTNVETKINTLKTKVEQANEKRATDKKIKKDIFDEIDNLKTAAGLLKDKETKLKFKEEADKFTPKVEALVTNLKTEINK
ncbi:hypothetical protein [Candidatus Phytoplasma sp. AldY-WA1]|uniref:hypothetical protein n=1 Tax=Candidatus Phytoplasma sp. AldY-WA1 TaxID=2852100 RepID=UPI00254D8462|nr:hypothetical protein [Candidatus Phytoplasma sp. AldY-WA1]